MKVDLGCGIKKQTGFIGVDRFSLPDVDIVADVDEGLPFEDNSVELLFASHSLEHVKNLTNVMREIYRICKHGAQVCILAPYSEQKLNIANPYHLFQFNEHTPRFWTNHPTTAISTEHWVHPHASNWGLGDSDHHDLKMDLRCFKMEFFYFPEYLSMPEKEKIKARKSQIDVCDQIMYHLIVIKNEVSNEEIDAMVSNIHWYEPPVVTMRRYYEQSIVQKVERTALEMELIAAREEISVLQIQKANKDVELELYSQKVDILINEKLQLGSLLSTSEQKYNKVQVLIDQLNAENNELNRINSKLKAKNQDLSRESISVTDLMESVFNTHLWKLKKIIGKKIDLWSQVDIAFREYKDQALIYGYKGKGDYLDLGTDLRNHEFVSYELDKIVPGNLIGIGLALSYPITPTEGIIGIELVENHNKILAVSIINCENLVKGTPVTFSFNMVSVNSHLNSYAVRIFVKNSKVPIRIYSFQKKYRKKERPFICCHWEDSK